MINISLKARLKYFPAILAVLTINGLFLSLFSFRTFKFYDMGTHLDAAWRIYQGQKPYVDFMWYVGPIHSYLSAFFFKIFGFGKTALLWHMITVSSIVILVTYRICRKFASLGASLIVACLAMTCFYWPYQIPWYTHTALLWLILSISSLAATVPFETKKTAWTAGFVCGLLGVVSFLTKPNCGVLQNGLVFLILLSARSKRASLHGFGLGLSLSFLFCWFFFIPSLREFLCQTIFLYGNSQNARWSIIWYLNLLIWKNYYWLVALPLIPNLWLHLIKHRTLVLMFFGLWLVAILITFSSGALYYSDVGLMGLYGALAVDLLYRERVYLTNPRSLSSRLWSVRKNTLLVILGGLTILYTRYGINVEAWAWNDVQLLAKPARINPIGNYTLQSRPLDGWKCFERQGRAVDGIVQFMKREADPNDTLLVLSDLFILNSLTGLKSTPKITCGFTREVWPCRGPQREEVRQQIMRHPPKWIILCRIYAPFMNGMIKYLDLGWYLQHNYVIRKNINTYLILERIG